MIYKLPSYSHPKGQKGLLFTQSCMYLHVYSRNRDTVLENCVHSPKEVIQEKKKGVHALKEVIQEKDQQIGVSC